MSSSKANHEPVDPKRALSITAYPWTGGTTVEVDVGYSDSLGRHRSRLAYWHFDLTRSDLAGKSTDDVIRLLCQRVLRRLESSADPADQVTARSPDRPAAPAPPSGATGGAYSEPALPGLEPTL